MALKLNGTNSVAAPAYAGADADTGLQCGTNELKLVTGGSARATVNSSGNLLVGTTSDSIYNDTSGGGFNIKNDGQLVLAKEATSSADPLVWLNDTGQTTNKSIVFAQDGSEKANIGLAGNDATVTVNGSERMRIDSSGNVNIGSNISSNPFTYLRFGASQYGAADIRPTNEADHKVGLSFYTDGTADTTINPTERLRIDSSGFVGINCTPRAQLEVKTGTDANILMTTMSSEAAIEVFNDAGNANVPFRLRASEHKFFISGTEYMRLDSSGNLGVGLSSIGEKLDVNGTIRCRASGFGGVLKLGHGSSFHGRVEYNYNNGNSKELFLNSVGGGGIITFKCNSTEHFRIASNGTLTATDTSIGSNSDSRLKTNITDFSYSLEDFKQYQPKTFDWKNPELHGNQAGQRGFIAQEVEAIDAYWVDQQAVDEGSEDAQYLNEDRLAKTLKLGKKDAMYVSVIQQLLTKIETLETKVAALEVAS